MGAQSSLLTLVGAAGITANKAAEGFKQASNLSNQVERQISEANDADKNELMAQKAKLNAYKLKTQKMKAQTERRNARLKSMQSKEEMKKYKETLKKEDNPNG